MTSRRSSWDIGPIASIFPLSSRATRLQIASTSERIWLEKNTVRPCAFISRMIERICARHGVPLPAAALQFPLGHPSVAAVIPGTASPAEVEVAVRIIEVEIPQALWDELRAEGLIAAEAPTPGAGGSPP